MYFQLAVCVRLLHLHRGGNTHVSIVSARFASAGVGIVPQEYEGKHSPSNRIVVPWWYWFHP